MNVPSTTPHGYTRPLTLRPPESTTVLLPTTANGTRSCNNIKSMPVMSPFNCCDSYWARNQGFYRPQRSCGKIMFLHVSVILSTVGGFVAGRHPLKALIPFSYGTATASGRYASYWNVFLFWLLFQWEFNTFNFFCNLFSSSSSQSGNSYILILCCAISFNIWKIDKIILTEAFRG